MLSAGLDYVSVTARSGEPAERLIALGRGIVRDEMHAGNQLRSPEWKGYAMERAGQAALGIRREDALVQVSGSAAYLFGLPLLQLAGHASRADLQVTMHSADWIVRDLIWRAMYKPDHRRGKGRPITRKFIDTSNEGATCYIGSPRSDQLGRFYDKGRESPEQYEEGTARLEVQYRNHAAEGVRLRAVAGMLTDVAIRGTVGKWFMDRGALAGIRLPVGDAIKPTTRAETDYEAHRRWLRECVAPAIRRYRHIAPPRAVLHDLGLTELGDIIDEESDAPIQHANDDASR